MFEKAIKFEKQACNMLIGFWIATKRANSPQKSHTAVDRFYTRSGVCTLLRLIARKVVISESKLWNQQSHFLPNNNSSRLCSGFFDYALNATTLFVIFS